MSLGRGAGDMVFSFRQGGNAITGEVEAAGGGGFFGGSPGGVIEDGKIDGANISFRAGSATYSGTVTGERIELQRTMDPFRRPGMVPPQASGPRPAVGPPPDGTDPSFGAGFGGRRGQGAAPLILRRVQR
jgi:beta-galactosidase